MIGVFKGNALKADMIKFNGEYILDNICTMMKITENATEFYLEATFNINKKENGDIYNLICNNSVLKVSDEYGDEYFRICEARKQGRIIVVYARQISIQDTLTMFLEDCRPTGMNGQATLEKIFNDSTTPNKFQVYSDIGTVNTAYYIKKTVYEAMNTADNSFLTRWGGEIQRRGFTIRVNKKIGSDRGVTIQSRKNLIGLEETTNLNSLMTRIYPEGFNGITINEKYLDSPFINAYPCIYSKTLKFEDIRVNDENYSEGFATLEEAQQELKNRVVAMYESGCDIIKGSYRVVFAELGKSEEYKNYSILESTSVGDTVRVYDEETGINISVRVTERIYDVLKGRRIETALSNFSTKKVNLGDLVGKLEDLENKTEENKNDIGKVIEEAKDIATSIIESGIKNSHVLVKKNEILIMDTPDVNTAMKLWRWNNGGLGFSNTGYFGRYETAITNNGSIVADFINAGVLNANIIKAGVIRSLTGDTWINIANGTFNFGNKVSFDGNNFSIDLTGKDLATNTSVDQKLQTKVGTSEVKSIIEQNPASVKIGFNGINNTFEVTASEVIQRTSTGAKSMVFSNGETKYYNTSTGENVGRIGSSIYDNYNNACGVGIYTKEGSFVGVGCRNDATNRLESYLNVYNGARLPYLNPGINIYKPMHMNYEEVWNPIINFNSDDTCGIWGTTSGDSVTVSANKELLLCHRNINSPSELTVRMCIRDSEIYVQNDMYFAGSTPYYSIRNAIIQNCTIKANTLASESISTFALNENTEKFISKGIVDTVETVGVIEVVNGTATIKLPADIAYTNYYVFLSCVGKTQPYIVSENDNDVVIGCDEDKKIKYLIKFEIPQFATLETKESYTPPEPQQPTKAEMEKVAFTSTYK